MKESNTMRFNTIAQAWDSLHATLITSNVGPLTKEKRGNYELLFYTGFSAALGMLNECASTDEDGSKTSDFLLALEDEGRARMNEKAGNHG